MEYGIWNMEYEGCVAALGVDTPFELRLSRFDRYVCLRAGCDCSAAVFQLFDLAGEERHPGFRIRTGGLGAGRRCVHAAAHALALLRAGRACALDSTLSLECQSESKA